VNFDVMASTKTIQVLHFVTRLLRYEDGIILSSLKLCSAIRWSYVSFVGVRRLGSRSSLSSGHGTPFGGKSASQKFNCSHIVVIWPGI
jgi:hypothetical protein